MRWKRDRSENKRTVSGLPGRFSLRLLGNLVKQRSFVQRLFNFDSDLRSLFGMSGVLMIELQRLYFLSKVGAPLSIGKANLITDGEIIDESDDGHTNLVVEVDDFADFCVYRKSPPD